MGCLNSTDSDKSTDKDVASRPSNDDEPDEKTYKLLLLGAGGSGKSTVFRQVKILYGGGYDEDERLTLAVTIHQNMVQSIKKIVDQCAKYEPLNDEDVTTRISKLPDDGPYKDVEDIGSLIKDLWGRDAVKLAYSQRANYQLPTDTIHYFFDKAQDIMQDDYLPSQEDLLHCRIHSTGVKSETFSMEDDSLQFRLLDVGGQRSERKKWVRCFENVTAVLYVVAISEYDQLCYEDNETNRVLEALDLFEDIANSEWFADIDIILFLNKRDLFAEKIKTVPLKSFFPQFNGEGYASGIEFLEKEFDERNQQEREVITHVTCATNTDDIKNVFEDKVKAILAEKQTLKIM